MIHPPVTCKRCGLKSTEITVTLRQPGSEPLAIVEVFRDLTQMAVRKLILEGNCPWCTAVKLAPRKVVENYSEIPVDSMSHLRS